MSLSTRLIHAPALGLLLWIIVAYTAGAAPAPPIWRQNLTCKPAIQKYRGLEYCTGLGGQAHIVVVDLQSSDVRLEYVIAKGVDDSGRFGECRDVNIPRFGPVRGGCADPSNLTYYPVMSMGEAANRYPSTAAVVNSDYGAGTQNEPSSRGHGPEGFTVVRGDRLDGPANGDIDNNAVRRPWLAISQNMPLRAELSQFAPGQDNGDKPDWIYTGVGGGPWLIRNGRIEETQIRNCRNANPHSCQSNVAQTAVGLSRDQRWLFLVVAEGQDARGTARFLHDDLQAWDAIKFDGGGSSQLWYGEQFINRGDGRRLSHYLVVIAEPGSGIEDLTDRPPLSANPTLPLFFDLVLPQETAHLHIEIRNTGTDAWESIQGIELRRVHKDTVSPTVESYPLPHSVAPGETVTWDVELNADNARYRALSFRMYQGDSPFGPEVSAVVVTLPEQLESQRERLSQLIEEELKEWQDQTEQEVERRLEEFRTWLLELIRREAERQARGLLDRICGADAMLLMGALLVVLQFRRR